MKGWKLMAALAVPALLIVGLGIFFIQRARNAPVEITPKYVERKMTDDDVAQPRKLYIDDIKSARDLDGKTVWMKLGYELDYYPYTAGHADFGHSLGTIPGATPMQIESFVMQKAPESLATRIAHGDKQVLAVFTEPDSPKKYAAPIGYVQGADSKFYCDDFFYYDDPHGIYKHWTPDVWDAVEHHEGKVGMSETQAAMALGVIQQSDSTNQGDRSVRYDLNGKYVDMVFEHGHATSVKAE